MAVVSCPELSTTNFSNGYTYTSGSYPAEGSYIRYLCNYGYYRDGPHSRTCLSNRTWSGRQPRCGKNSYVIHGYKICNAFILHSN